MNTLSALRFPLLATLLTLSIACDDELYSDDFAAGETTPRDGDGDGPIFNTPVFGPYSLVNIAKDFNLTVTNSESSVEFLSGTVPYGGNPTHPIERWEIEDDGELKIFVIGSNLREVQIDGADVEGAQFTIQITPTADPAFQTAIMVTDAECAEFPACSYELVTTLPNSNPGDYPARTYGGQVVYPICSGTAYQSELGLYMNRVFFAKSINTDVTNADFPLSPESSVDSIFCAADAFGHVRSQLALDATYTFPGNSHPRALADNAQNNAIVMAITARFRGKNLTEPGKKICLVDTDQGLFEDPNDCEQSGFKLEGVYGASADPLEDSGLLCKPSVFAHRLIEEEDFGTTYDSLPVCPNDLVTGLPAHATIAVYVEVPLLAINPPMP